MASLAWLQHHSLWCRLFEDVNHQVHTIFTRSVHHLMDHEIIDLHTVVTGNLFILSIPCCSSMELQAQSRASRLKAGRTSKTLSSTQSMPTQEPCGGGWQFRSYAASLDEEQSGQEKNEMVGFVFRTTCNLCALHRHRISSSRSSIAGHPPAANMHGHNVHMAAHNLAAPLGRQNRTSVPKGRCPYEA